MLDENNNNINEPVDLNYSTKRLSFTKLVDKLDLPQIDKNINLA